MKYTSKGSSMAFDRIKDPELKFPDLLICPRPGFKNAEMANLSDVTDNPWQALETIGGTDEVKNLSNYLFYSVSTKSTVVHRYKWHTYVECHGKESALLFGKEDSVFLCIDQKLFS